MLHDKMHRDVLEQDRHDSGVPTASHAKHNIGWWN